MIHYKDAERIDLDGHSYYKLLDEKSGCVYGCKMGISIYTNSVYCSTAIHDTQEGFFVFEGSGYAKIGNKEYFIEPGTSFIVPAKTEHTVRKNENGDMIKLFWFHAAVS